MSKISIRDALLQIDKDTCCQHDLCTLYESLDLTDDEKVEIVRMCSEKEDPEVIYNYLCKKFKTDDFSSFDNREEFTSLHDRMYNVDTSPEDLKSTMDSLVESKADQQQFIDTFGKEAFDDFQKWKPRLKNKGYSVDLTYHVKNTSPDDMLQILDSVSDDSHEQDLDYEGRQIPSDNKQYKIIEKTSKWTIYKPTDYIGSIYAAHGGRWCTAGGYRIPEGKVKVSQAEHYFNEYTDRGIDLYYCINNQDVEDSVAIASNGGKTQVFNHDDNAISIESVDSDLKQLLIDNSIIPPEMYVEGDSLIRYTGIDSNVVVPEGVKYIKDEAFQNTSVKSVTLPDSVVSIGEHAFDECHQLQDIKLSANLTSIGKGAFSACIALRTIDFPESLEVIGYAAFEECTNLQKIRIPSKVSKIEPFSFKNCLSLSDIVLESGITSIARMAFYGCKSLTSIDIPNTVVEIGNSAFRETALESIKLPSGLKIIDSGVFDTCELLDSITIPNGVESIGEFAFDACSSLREVVIPDTVTKIRNWAFSECPNLVNVKMSKNLQALGYYAFDHCTSLKAITLPDSVEHIGEGVFDLCRNLTVYTNNEIVIDYCKKNDIRYKTGVKESFDDTNDKNIMTINLYSGINSDGFNVDIADEAGNTVFQKNYRYGYNASYSDDWADSSKPFVSDIIDKLCSEYNINKEDIQFGKGKNVFRGTDIPADDIKLFKANYIDK